VLYEGGGNQGFVGLWPRSGTGNKSPVAVALIEEPPCPVIGIAAGNSVSACAGPNNGVLD
jgi:hypothetical protein